MTALGMGEARITDEAGQVRRAACIGGMLSVLNGQVRLVATTWEWAEDIGQGPRRECPQAQWRNRWQKPPKNRPRHGRGGPSAPCAGAPARGRKVSPD